MASRKTQRATMIIIPLLGITWISLLFNAYLRRENSRLLTERRFPNLISGTSLNIVPLTREVGVSNGYTPGEYNRHLVLVSDDTCGACKRNVTHWEILLKSAKMGPGLDVWLVTFNNFELFDPLIAVLRSRRVPFRMLALREPASVFTLRTGIVAVPTTLTLNREMLVELIHVGEFSGPLLLLFTRMLNSSFNETSASLRLSTHSFRLS